MPELAGAQLYQYFKDSGIKPREAAYKAGISYQHMIELLNGSHKMTDSARAKIARAFPETISFLLQIELPGLAGLDVHNPETEAAR